MDPNDMKDRQVNNEPLVGFRGNDEAGLDDLFRAYKLVCSDPEPSVNFMPGLWAKIEAREASRTIFSRVAKTLVTAALGASVVMLLLSSSYNQPAPSFEGSYLQALAADHASNLEPLQVERISELEQ